MRFLKRLLPRLGFTSVMLVVVPAVITFIWLRAFGLPAQAKVFLLSELEARGLAVSVESVQLDPAGGVLAKKLIVYRGLDRQQIWVEVDRVRIGIAWLSWWRGRPLITNATVTNATVQLPVGGEVAELENVSAAVVFQPHTLEVLSAEARMMQFQMHMRGRIHLDGLPQSRPVTPQQMADRERLWRLFRDHAAEVKSDHPIGAQVDFEFSTLKPELANIDFSVVSHEASWRDAPLEEFSLAGSIKDSIIRLDDLRMRLPRGELVIDAEVSLPDRVADVSFSSNADFTVIASAVPEKVRDALRQVEFRSLPQISGRCRFDWTQKEVKSEIQADIDWRDFAYNGVRFKRLVLPIAFDGKRLLVPDASLITERGDLNFEVYYDMNKPEARARVLSSLDPTSLHGLFGEKADRFLESLQFINEGPKIAATATGTAFKTDALSISGEVSAKDFSYKHVAFEDVQGAFTFADSRLSVPDLKIDRHDGNAGGNLIYDFKNRTVALKNFHSSVGVQEVAPVLGPKFEGYVKPYVFNRPPDLKVEGFVDLKNENANLETKLNIDVATNATMTWELFHVPFKFENPQGRLRFLNRHLDVDITRSGLFGGTIIGKLGIELQKPARYTTKFSLANCDFHSLMSTAFKYQKTSGTLNGQIEFSGVVGRTDSMKGTGSAVIHDGYLTTIPWLGSMSSVVSAIVPDFGYAKADRARCQFTLNDGFVTTNELNIASDNFVLIGGGRYNYVKDNLDMDMRVNVRGALGAMFFVASKLFEYHGSGPMKDPKWEPKNF